MKEFSSAMNLALVKLPATKGSRQSIDVQLPTAILKNLLRARSFVGVMFTTPMIFFTHNCLVTHPMVRTIMNAAQVVIEKKLAELSEIGFFEKSEVKPQLETIKTRVFRACARMDSKRLRWRRSKQLTTGGGRAPPLSRACA
jgi:hypothetical protein